MKAGSWVLAMVALVAGPALEVAGQDYQFARISYVEGGFYLQRAQNYDTGEVGVNTPIGSGDSVWTENGARLEIEFDAGSYLRLDQNTRVDIRSIGGTDTVTLQGGNMYLDLRSSRPFRVDAPIASVDIVEPGVYRIDMQGNGTLFVAVFQGTAEVKNGAGSIVVRSGQETQIMAGRVPGYPTPFSMARRDAFDDFQDARAGSFNYAYDSPGYLPEEIRGYDYELADYGRWNYVSPYGNVWVPYAATSNWRPYRDGYWDYIPGCGYTWTSYEPWGWAPYHYGRWDWVLGIGWFWIPGSVWGPAWVSWGYYGDYYGWCPLNWYDRPVHCYNNYYDHWWGDNYVHNPDYNSWTFIPKEHIGSRDLTRVALGENQVRMIDKVSVSKDLASLAPKGGISRSPVKGGSDIMRERTAGANGVRKIEDPGRSSSGGLSTTTPGYRTGPKGGSSVTTTPGNNIYYSGPKGGTTTPQNDNPVIYRTGPKGGSTTPQNNDPVIYRTGPKGGSTTPQNDNPVIYRSGPKGGSTVTPEPQNNTVIYRGGTKGGSSTSVDIQDPGSNRSRVYYIPAPSNNGSSTRTDPNSGGYGYRSYENRSGSGTNALTIRRDPEERQYYDSPYGAVRERDSGSTSFWGKVYEQYRSSSGGNSVSGGSSSRSVSPKGGSSSSGSSRYSSPPSRSSSPAPSRSPSVSSSPKSSGGSSVRKKD